MAGNRIPAGAVRQAVGSHEAAGLLGVHHTVVGKMVQRGWLSAHLLDAAHSAAATKRYAIYDGGECDRNFREYEEDGHLGRPRAWTHMRPRVLKHLAGVQKPISFDDAIGPAEASRILNVHPSFLARLAAAGEIIGRRPWSPSASTGLAMSWFYSRSSCLANARKVRQMQAAGEKVGRPRKLS